MKRPTHFELFDINTLTGFFLAPRVLTKTMDRDAFTRMQKTAHRIRLHLLVAQRDDIDEPLRLRAIVGEIIFSRMHLNGNVFFKVADFGRVERQLVPPGNWGREIVVEKRIAISVVATRP